MAPRWARPAIDLLRTQLRTSAQRRPRVRDAMVRAAHELQAALDDGLYGEQYFGVGRDATDREGLSGYERYDRDSSNANAAAFVVWSTFDANTALDVGCATGFVVEALRELGIDAQGVDVSQYAVDHAALGARGHLKRMNASQGLRFPDGSFDVVTVLETLEHLEPSDVNRVIGEVARVARGYVMATIPSFGPNRNGPGGWFQAKVRDDRVEYYESLGPEFGGPIPYTDLYRDAAGQPVEGHLTIASFEWWTARFAEAGLVRCDEAERRAHPDLAQFGLTKYWNLYLLRKDDAPEPDPGLRSPAARDELKRRFGLAERVASPEDLAAVRSVLG